MDNKKFITIALILVVIIGLIALGFSAVKMVNKWLGRKAKAEVTQKIFGGITGVLPVRLPGNP